MIDDAEACVIAKGPRSTRIVETIDQVEPEFEAFVRQTARRLDPAFPRSGLRAQGKRGQFTSDAGVQTLFTEVDTFDSDGRGIRTQRFMYVGEAGGPHNGALSVAAIGLENDATLTVRWNYVVAATEITGISAALFVRGAAKENCIVDFRDWFDVLTS
jgi:hypothetical protein